MSYQATAYVLQLRGLSISEKAVALVLAHHAAKDGSNSYPSMTTVAEEAGLKHRQTASSIVHRLEGTGIIQATSEGNGGRSRTTRYRFPGVPQFKLGKCNSPVAVSQPESATLTALKCNSGDVKCNFDSSKVQLPSCTNSLNRKENGKEKRASTPLFPLTENRGQESPENGKSTAREFFIWILSKYPGASLPSREKAELSKDIGKSSYDLSILKQAADDLLREIDLSSSFGRTEAKRALAANLLDKAEGVVRDRAQRALDREQFEAGKIRQEREAAEERAKRAAEKVEEPEDIPVWE
ncbi:MAG: helix-turn-helix domain-containing protein [Acidobacteriaceae bacterium]